eukprot:SAG11_NODE_100_length_16863_cov_12.374911_11_plen_132_part_00
MVAAIYFRRSGPSLTQAKAGCVPGKERPTTLSKVPFGIIYLVDMIVRGCSLLLLTKVPSSFCWIAALEAAAREAKRSELNVYEAFALYDLQGVRTTAKLPEDDKLRKRLKDLVKAMITPPQVLLDAIATMS